METCGTRPPSATFTCDVSQEGDGGRTTYGNIWGPTRPPKMVLKALVRNTKRYLSGLSDPNRGARSKFPQGVLPWASYK